MEPKICPCCGQPFQPRPQVQNQTYCSSPACQRERRQTWQRKKLQDDRFYRENQQDAQRAWRERNPDYSRNRHGLIASAVVTTADGYAEREAAKVMIADAKQVADERAQITLGADKGYDAAEFIEALTDMKVLPHVAQNTSNRKSAVPEHIAASDGYPTID